MSRREDIDNAIWDDPDFAALSANATLLYLWSWTNPRCGMAGLYKVGHRAMTESKVSAEAIPAALEELAAGRFAYYEGSVLWVRSRVKHLRSRTTPIAISIGRDVAKVAVGHPLREAFLREYGSWSWLEGNLPEPSPEPQVNLTENPENTSHYVNLNRGSPEPHGLWQGKGQGSFTGEVDLPDDYPRELEPHLDTVHRVLSGLAARHHAQAVSRLSLASVLMARPRKPLVRAAHDFAAWADAKAQRRKDVVAGYRNWLDKTDDLAATESLGPVGNVVSIPPRDPHLERMDAWKHGYDEEAS